MRGSMFGAVALLAAIGAAPAVAQEQAPAPAATIQVGSLTLTACQPDFGGFCGRITRPLDPAGALPGTVTIGFEYYPRRDIDQPAEGVILAQEGGPGYSSTGTREGYLRLFEPLRDRRDTLLIDKRGTGLSDPIQCQALQEAGEFVPAAIAACGKQLGPAAWMYGTALAADDVAAVLDALQIGKVDFYGDSYGTWFGQIFAQRHPDRLRTLVLDSAYPTIGLSPWFETEWATARDGFELVCRRSPSCRALGGRSIERIERLLAALRASPSKAEAPDGDGNTVGIAVDAPTLFLTMNSAGGSPTFYRELDAAARAFLDGQDPAPLHRLMAEASSWNTPGSDASAFSTALYAAVVCSDYPRLFRAEASRSERRRQLARATAQKTATDREVYTPFTIAEIDGSPHKWERRDLCLDWPAPPKGVVPGTAADPGEPFPNVPTLVLSGDIDSITSPIEGLETARLFPDATYVPVRNLTHITAITDQAIFVPPKGADATGCVAPIVLTFVRSGGDAGDTSCTQRIRPIRTVPAFAIKAADVAPAKADAGNAATEADLRIASAAAETAGDVLARYFVNSTGGGVGLRGGTFGFEAFDEGYAFILDQLRWVEDLAVSGTVRWNQATGDIAAELTLAGAATGTLALAWNDRDTDAMARITGTIEGRTVAAERLAP
ncbi:alpha/beta fold hydrolase [Inquilinus limosus]|uniref:alpha/beta fold hydrolase n=1 Tax=Inquilinus limosus TaxID=171674 RepID=UPI00047ECF64|nr:alpha/beta hydrolase [Inquilinus limosus]